MSWGNKGKWLGFGLLGLFLLLSVAVGSKHYWFNRYHAEEKQRYIEMYQARDLSKAEVIFLGDQSLETIQASGFQIYSENLSFMGAEIGDFDNFRLSTVSDSSLFVIQLGYNDLLTNDPKTVFNAWQAFIRKVKAQAPTSEILVLSTIPSGLKAQSDIDADRLRDLNLHLRDHCAEQRIEFLNVFNPLINFQGLLAYTDDETFLNSEGSKILEGLLIKRVKKIRTN